MKDNPLIYYYHKVKHRYNMVGIDYMKQSLNCELNLIRIILYHFPTQEQLRNVNNRTSSMRTTMRKNLITPQKIQNKTITYSKQIVI